MFLIDCLWLTTLQDHLDDMPAIGYARAGIAADRIQEYLLLLYGHAANCKSAQSFLDQPSAGVAWINQAPECVFERLLVITDQGRGSFFTTEQQSLYQDAANPNWRASLGAMSSCLAFSRVLSPFPRSLSLTSWQVRSRQASARRARCSCRQ